LDRQSKEQADAKGSPIRDRACVSSCSGITVTRRGGALAKRAVSVIEAADADFFRPAGSQKALLNVLHHLAD
jgi:hypothetical protein